MIPFEFIVDGPPVSSQTKNRASYQAGFRYQVKKRNLKRNLNWYGSANVTTEKQMEDLIEGINKFQKSKDDNILIELGFLDKNAIKKS